MSKYRAGISPFILFFLLLFVLAPLQPLFGENTVYEFGPKTDTVIVFTAAADSESQSTTATLQLHEFAQKLAVTPPADLDVPLDPGLIGLEREMDMLFFDLGRTGYIRPED